MKVKKRIVIVQIIGFAFLRSLFLLYDWYLHKGNDLGFWRLLFGGIEVADSKNILDVVIYIFPDFLFYYYVCSKYIRQLKENYLYIFVRERNMKRWLRKFTAISFLDILFYETITVLMLLLAGIGMQEIPAVQSDEFLFIILCQFIKLAIVVIFCNMLLLKFHEIVSVYANLLVQALPLLCVGILYDMDGAWEMAIKYIPVNWCNYNYLMELNANPPIMICLSVVLGGIMYFYSEKFDVLKVIS